MINRLRLISQDRSAVVLGLLVLLTVLVYAQTLRNEFVYDDKILIAGNKFLQRIDAIPRLFVTDWWKGVEEEIGRAVEEDGRSGTGDRRYRPLAAVTYVLNYVVGGPAPWGYHLINVLLHAGVSGLLYLLALELGWPVGAAVVAAVLFAVHPLHTEAVAWVVGRPELLMALSVLGGLWCEIRGYRATALVVFGLGLLSKEQAVVLPALLLLIDLCRGKGTVPRGQRVAYVIRRYGPYGVVLGVYLAVRTAVMGGFRPPAYPFLQNPLEYAEGWTWVWSVLQLDGRYLWLSLWPAALSVDYSYNAIPWATALWEPGVLWALGAWGGLLALGLWGWGRDRRITLAVGMTVVPFAPVANVLVSVGTPMAERLFYLPLAGLCLLAGLGYAYVRAQVVRRPSQLALQGIVVGLCLALTVRTIVRLQDWKSSETLFTSAIPVVPDNAKLHVMLGDEFMKERDPEGLKRALMEYRRAMDLYPDYLNRHSTLALNFGSVLFDLGHMDEALEAMKLAVSLSPWWSRTHYDLGLVYARLKQYEQAEAAWNQALALRPHDVELRSRLSRLLIERGRYSEGLAVADAALARDPDFVLAAYNRALALQALGRVEEAVVGYERVLAIPGAPEEAKQDVQKKLNSLRTCPPGSARC